MTARVEAVATDLRHRFSKPTADRIVLLAGLGAQGDAHCGGTVKHRSRARFTPQAPNLRQVHLIHGELHDALRAAGFDVGPGVMGENVTTRGLDLLGLGRGTILRLGPEATLEVTGLRNPCLQLDRYAPGLMAACIGADAAGAPTLRAGIMSIVLTGGEVRPGDAIVVETPAGPHIPLRKV